MAGCVRGSAQTAGRVLGERHDGLHVRITRLAPNSRTKRWAKRSACARAVAENARRSAVPSARSRA